MKASGGFLKFGNFRKVKMYRRDEVRTTSNFITIKTKKAHKSLVYGSLSALD